MKEHNSKKILTFTTCTSTPRAKTTAAVTAAHTARTTAAPTPATKTAKTMDMGTGTGTGTVNTARTTAASTASQGTHMYLSNNDVNFRRGGRVDQTDHLRITARCRQTKVSELCYFAFASWGWCAHWDFFHLLGLSFVGFMN